MNLCKLVEETCMSSANIEFNFDQITKHNQAKGYIYNYIYVQQTTTTKHRFHKIAVILIEIAKDKNTLFILKEAQKKSKSCVKISIKKMFRSDFLCKFCDCFFFRRIFIQ